MPVNLKHRSLRMLVCFPAARERQKQKREKDLLGTAPQLDLNEEEEEYLRNHVEKKKER